MAVPCPQGDGEGGDREEWKKQLADFSIIDDSTKESDLSSFFLQQFSESPAANANDASNNKNSVLGFSRPCKRSKIGHVDFNDSDASMEIRESPWKLPENHEMQFNIVPKTVRIGMLNNPPPMNDYMRSPWRSPVSGLKYEPGKSPAMFRNPYESPAWSRSPAVVAPSEPEPAVGDHSHATPAATPEATPHREASPSDASDDANEELEGGHLISWAHDQRANGADPHEVLRTLTELAETSRVPDSMMWEMCNELAKTISHFKHPPLPPAFGSPGYTRRKLPHISTMKDVCKLLEASSNILVLTGAGISVSAGIPDFRSKKGIYSRLRDEFGMPEPECMFDIKYFRERPEIFFSFAKELWPGSHSPTITHQFIKCLEDKGKLLRNYTQNIDALEYAAGIKKVFQCHGSFATASCMTCKLCVPGDTLQEDVMAQRIAKCPRCWPNNKADEIVPETRMSHSGDECDEKSDNVGGESKEISSGFEGGGVEGNRPERERTFGVMKPDIVFFGQQLPDNFDAYFMADKEVADMAIVIGSSLKVHPVASMLENLPPNVPLILINLEVVGQPHSFDVELLGKCDDICSALCDEVGWSLGMDTDTDDAKTKIPVPVEVNVKSAPTRPRSSSPKKKLSPHPPSSVLPLSLSPRISPLLAPSPHQQRNPPFEGLSVDENSANCANTPVIDSALPLAKSVTTHQETTPPANSRKRTNGSSRSLFGDGSLYTRSENQLGSIPPLRMEKSVS